MSTSDVICLVGASETNARVDVKVYTSPTTTKTVSVYRNQCSNARGVHTTGIRSFTPVTWDCWSRWGFCYRKGQTYTWTGSGKLELRGGPPPSSGSW